MNIWSALGIGICVVCVAAISGCSNSGSSSNPPAPGGGTATQTGAATTAPATAAAPVKPPFERPVLENRSGEYFSYSVPAGWKVSETANGVDLTSPDGKLIASSAMLAGTPGSNTPWGFVNMVLKGIGATNIKLIASKDQPSQKSGYPGINWTIQEIELTCTNKEGEFRHAAFTCGICNAYGSYSALIQTFSSPEDQYDQAKTWLPLLVENVKVANPSKVAYQDHVLLAQNHPLDNSALMDSWKLRRQSQDRIDQKQHETTMGYERMVSPINGQHYNMPFENYDGTMGGYRDPADRNRILNHAPPGE